MLCSLIYSKLFRRIWRLPHVEHIPIGLTFYVADGAGITGLKKKKKSIAIVTSLRGATSAVFTCTFFILLVLQD